MATVAFSTLGVRACKLLAGIESASTVAPSDASAVNPDAAGDGALDALAAGDGSLDAPRYADSAAPCLAAAGARCKLRP